MEKLHLLAKHLKLGCNSALNISNQMSKICIVSQSSHREGDTWSPENSVPFLPSCSHQYNLSPTSVVFLPPTPLWLQLFTKLQPLYWAEMEEKVIVRISWGSVISDWIQIQLFSYCSFSTMPERKWNSDLWLFCNLKTADNIKTNIFLHTCGRHLLKSKETFPLF